MFAMGAGHKPGAVFVGAKIAFSGEGESMLGVWS